MFLISSLSHTCRLRYFSDKIVLLPWPYIGSCLGKCYFQLIIAEKLPKFSIILHLEKILVTTSAFFEGSILRSTWHIRIHRILNAFRYEVNVWCSHKETQYKGNDLPTDATLNGGIRLVFRSQQIKIPIQFRSNNYTLVQLIQLIKPFWFQRRLCYLFTLFVPSNSDSCFAFTLLVSHFWFSWSHRTIRTYDGNREAKEVYFGFRQTNAGYLKRVHWAQMAMILSYTSIVYNSSI